MSFEERTLKRWTLGRLFIPFTCVGSLTVWEVTCRKPMFTFFDSQPHSPTPTQAVPGLPALTHQERQAFSHLGLQLCQSISPHLQDFWGLKSQWHFQGVWYRLPPLWQKEGLLEVAGSLPRMSDSYDPIALPYNAYANHALYESLLRYSLGEASHKTSSSAPLTTLESFVVRDYLEQWVVHALKILVPERVELSSERPVHMEGVMTFVFTATSGVTPLEEGVGKLMLQVPVSVLKTVAKQFKPQPKHSWESVLAWSQGQGSCLTSPATLVAGLSTLKISELKGLEAGDLLVLEHSDVHYLGLKHPKSHVLQAFGINAELGSLEYFDPAWASPSPYSSPSAPNDQSPLASNHELHSTSPEQLHESSLTMMYPHTQVPTDAQQSLWDQLHVDVHAEFKPLRIPIQELRHMSQGLLIEVGDLLHNEIQLVTNSTTIAYGQLVVVGDKFGVLLTKVPGQEDAQALAPLGGQEVPLAPVSVAQSKQASGLTEQASSPQASPPSFEDDQDDEAPTPKIDPQLVAYCQNIGLHPQLAQTAISVGFNLQELVDAATQQGIGMNEFFVATFEHEQNNIPVPKLDDDDELSAELNRTTAMLEEVEDLLDDEDS